MDPDPQKFPILKYVMSQIPNLDPPLPPLPPPSPPPPSPSSDTELKPHISNKKLFNSMALIICDVITIRSFLRKLGNGGRPTLEEVQTARTKIAEIESRWSSSRQLQEEEEEEDHKDKSYYQSVLKVEELHQDYDKLLEKTELKLLKLSVSLEHFDKGLQVGVSQRREKLLANEQSCNLFEFSPARLEKLQELHLSGIRLHALPDNIELFSNLRILVVSSNKLSALPDAISNCSSLEELDASLNKLTYLPTNIGHGLVNLKRLSVQFNKIRSLPNSISEMRSLRQLEVHFNELCSVPYTIGRLTNLESLNLSGNFTDLTELPDTISQLSNLRELDLSNNQIRALPITFGQLTNITKLELDHNPLTFPPKEIADAGILSVMEYMKEKWLEEEKMTKREAKSRAKSALIKFSSSSWWKRTASMVSEGFSAYLGPEGKRPRDPCLDKML